MENFLASPLGKFAVVMMIALGLLTFGYHLVHNVHKAGADRRDITDISQSVGTDGNREQAIQAPH
jgi:hypothetical protein